jgi:hypothetical protein
MLYYIYQEGQRITTTPMTLQQIVTLYGAIKNLETQGFRIVEVNLKKGTV